MMMTRFALATLLLVGMSECVQAQYGPSRPVPPTAAKPQPAPRAGVRLASHSATARATATPQYVANRGIVATPTAQPPMNGAVPGWTGSYGPGYSPGSYGAVGGAPGSATSVVPVGPGTGGDGAGAMMGGAYGDVGGGSCGCGGGCGGCGSGHGCFQSGCPGGCGCRRFSWKSTGDMPQHMPYFPNAHGYYYFRPYNVVHVLQQQEMITRWGMDSRNPYDNRFFTPIYEQVEATLPPEPIDPATAYAQPSLYR